MKRDWKKTESAYYLPGARPELVTIPAFNFFSIRGAGNPNDTAFAECVGALYALAYAVKMSPKSGTAPDGYAEYRVYPLEGVWDLSEAAKRSGGPLDKDELVFRLMIRQPEFVTPDYARETLARTAAKKPSPLFEQVEFGPEEEGACVQMLHVGSYDAESASFAAMEAFCADSGLVRASRTHREIYLSDPKRTAPDRLKTVLRFRVAPRP